MIITSISSTLSLVFCWLCTCCCLRWRRRRNLMERRKRIRYQLLEDNDDEGDVECDLCCTLQSTNKKDSRLYQMSFVLKEVISLS